jgi:flavin reductase (DIM6/NTAB) family NADH-FMN oxidoreductase RutF
MAEPAAAPSVAATFHELVADLDYPVFVVTAGGGSERSGCLVGFATQVSIYPPRLIVFVSKANHTSDVALASRHLAVHVLSDRDRETARHFGEETGDEVDKFAAVEWDPGPDGVPVLRGCRGWVVGRVLDRLDAGDHVGHLLELVEAEVTGPRAGQLSFREVRSLQPGHPA